MKNLSILLVLSVLLTIGCNNQKETKNVPQVISFTQNADTIFEGDCVCFELKTQNIDSGRINCGDGIFFSMTNGEFGHCYYEVGNFRVSFETPGLEPQYLNVFVIPQKQELLQNYPKPDPNMFNNHIRGVAPVCAFTLYVDTKPSPFFITFSDGKNVYDKNGKRLN